jgi:hypothetical protein
VKAIAYALVLSIAASGLMIAPVSGAPASAIEPVPGDVEWPDNDVAVPYVEASSAAEAQAVLASASTARVTYGPCVLYPSTVYLRQSSGYNDVGSKPYTLCSQPVQSIQHKTQLATRRLLLWWTVRSTDIGGNFGVASYTQRNVGFTCQSTSSKVWKSSTTGTIVSGGRTYYATVFSPSKSVGCGT